MVARSKYMSSLHACAITSNAVSEMSSTRR